MKLEIVKEEVYAEPTWYFLRVDGVSITCSKILEEIEETYNAIVENPDILTKTKTILKSEEVFVNLQENK